MSATQEKHKPANAVECVALTPSEYLQAMMVGCMRCVQNRKNNAQHRRGAQRERAEEYSIRGSVGEAIVAKKLGVFWLGVGVLGGEDVGGRYEVRASHHQNPYLRLHEDDKDDKPYVLVRVVEGVGWFYGWMYGREGKHERYWGDKWNNNRPAYWIPVSDLRPMSELPE